MGFSCHTDSLNLSDPAGMTPRPICCPTYQKRHLSLITKIKLKRVPYLIQGRVTYVVRTTPSDSISLGDTRGTPVNRKMTKTYVVTLIRMKRRIRRRNRGRTPREGSMFGSGATHCWMKDQGQGRSDFSKSLKASNPVRCEPHILIPTANSNSTATAQVTQQDPLSDPTTHPVTA